MGTGDNNHHSEVTASDKGAETPKSCSGEGTLKPVGTRPNDKETQASKSRTGTHNPDVKGKAQESVGTNPIEGKGQKSIPSAGTLGVAAKPPEKTKGAGASPARLREWFEAFAAKKQALIGNKPPVGETNFKYSRDPTWWGG